MQWFSFDAYNKCSSNSVILVVGRTQYVFSQGQWYWNPFSFPQRIKCNNYPKVRRQIHNFNKHLKECPLYLPTMQKMTENQDQRQRE